jgi:hypothetical protein
MQGITQPQLENIRGKNGIRLFPYHHSLYNIATIYTAWTFYEALKVI